MKDLWPKPDRFLAVLKEGYPSLGFLIQKDFQETLFIDIEQDQKSVRLEEWPRL